MRTKIKNWARNCHFDELIAVKELKQEKWMIALSYIEYIGNFNIDDYTGNDSLKQSWKKILKTLNDMSDEEIEKINYTKNNII
jgi:hypothetical protein